MDRAHLRELVSELRKDLAGARERMAAATAEVTALESAISGLEFLSGAPPESTIPLDLEPARTNGAAEGDAPRGKEAVRRVLRESGRPMRAHEVIAQILTRGWIGSEAKNPGAAIRVAIRRLADEGEVEKVSTGVYKYAGEEVEPKTEA